MSSSKVCSHCWKVTQPLTIRQYNIFLLRTMGMSYKEIAENWQLSESTVRDHYKQAKDRIQNAIEDKSVLPLSFSLLSPLSPQLGGKGQSKTRLPKVFIDF